jgi:hypothetical protein
MKLVPLVLPIPLFAFIITIVAIAIPCHEASANDSLSVYFESYNRGEGAVYGPPLPPVEPNSPFCFESLDEATYALTYCCYSNKVLDVDIGVFGSHNPYNPDEGFLVGPCLTVSLHL